MNHLDTFEQSLLTELREHVSARARTTAARPRSRRQAWLAAPIAIGATVLAVGLVGIPGSDVGQPSAAAAYSVTADNEEIVVTITRLEDASGLEQALAEHGVEAEVTYGGREDQLAGVETYPLDGFTPEPDGFTPEPSGAGEKPLRAGSSPPSVAPPAQTPSNQFAASIDNGTLTFHIQRSSIPVGQVLHLEIAGALDKGLASFGWAWRSRN